MTQRTAIMGTTAAGSVVLLAVLGIAVATALGWADGDPRRTQATMLAAATSGCGALSGWLLARWARGQQPATAVATGLGATLLRLAPPLAALAWLSTPGNPLREVGAAGLLLVFYLALLAADVALNIMVGGHPQKKPGATGAN